MLCLLEGFAQQEALCLKQGILSIIEISPTWDSAQKETHAQQGTSMYHRDSIRQGCKNNN